MVAARQAGKIADTLLLLEHPHVYTLGRGASEAFIVSPPAGVPIHRVSRGGEVTYHGPGQLVGYPILKLEGPARDVHGYLRALEEVLIRALAACGISAGRREGLTGVWIGNRKIASLGVGIKRWVTLHGFAINVNPDLAYFGGIIPCGIAGCAMTSVAEQGHPEISQNEFSDIVEREFTGVFGYSKYEEASVAPELIVEGFGAAK